MEGNEFERKYKQLNMLGKGNYGTPPLTQARSTKLNSTTANKAKKLNITSPRRCSWKAFPSRKSSPPSERYLLLTQIEILEKLSKEISSSEIPFVVSYKEFFRIEHELIIIMEYCECNSFDMQAENSPPTSRVSRKTGRDSTKRSSLIGSFNYFSESKPSIAKIFSIGISSLPTFF